MIARYVEQLHDGSVKCLLCPRNCVLKEKQTGFCRVHYNSGGNLHNETYRLYSGISFDPIEKKPLYHFYPGRQILSVGSIGCNLHCQWCQNFEISQVGVSGSSRLLQYSPGDLLSFALQNRQNIGIAYTYNEPSINFETIIEVAELFQSNNFKNVMVTNGYVSNKPLLEYLKYIDAFNVDIKAFDEEIHLKYTGAKLKPILNNIKEIKKAGKHLELTCLIVPGVSDNLLKFKELVKWISGELGKDVPLHISKYFPRYNYSAGATSNETMNLICSAASESLNFVYVGNTNIDEFEKTNCPKCHTPVIDRKGYYSKILIKNSEGKCDNCDTKIFIC